MEEYYEQSVQFFSRSGSITGRGLKEAAAEMLDYQGSGMSVMEMSHRSQVFQEIIETAEADLRDL